MPAVRHLRPWRCSIGLQRRGESACSQLRLVECRHFSNFTEGGFITLDDSPTAPQLANVSYDLSFPGAGVAELGANWLTTVVLSTGKLADSERTCNQAGLLSENVANDISSRFAASVLPPVAESAEGGSLELAIAVSAGDAGVDNSLPACESTAGTPQQLSEIRPESGVELFGDIEVAVCARMPMDGSASTAYRNGGIVVADTSGRVPKASESAELVRPLAKSFELAPAGPTGTLPLLMGATILVSCGGLSCRRTSLRTGSPPSLHRQYAAVAVPISKDHRQRAGN